jgi:predicted peroxiredoxin
MAKMAIICNGSEPQNLYPTFMMGTTAAALGDAVILFFTPGGAPALKTGALERIQLKGYPDMKDLVHDFSGRILLCDLCFAALDIEPEELRSGIEIASVTTFLAETRDAVRTFCF